ncbi:hypothetical protein EI94DRAFT_1710019 [Lactarius quietus]|nr:hypothetical protein EI94DRAFT_1710019 [Lactarius quietus]
MCTKPAWILCNHLEMLVPPMADFRMQVNSNGSTTQMSIVIEQIISINPAHEVGVGGIGASTNNVSTHPIHSRKPLAKFGDAPTGGSPKFSKVKRKGDGKGKGIARPKKKLRMRLKDKELDSTDTNQGTHQQLRRLGQTMQGGLADEEEWGYSQLDAMATKDAQTLKKPVMHSSTGDGKHPESGVDAHFCSYPQFNDR